MDAKVFKKKGKEMIVLGIDPGFTATGYAVIKQEQQKTFLLLCDAIKLPPSKELPERIAIFHAFFDRLLTEWHITDLALETPFLGKNAQNFLKLGYLRGILYLLAHNHGTTLHEFSPSQVKRAVTGFGGADKEQVARVVLMLFPQLVRPERADATDALAVTLCGLWHRNDHLSTKMINR